MIRWSKKLNLDNERWKSIIKILVQFSRWPSRIGKISSYRDKWQPTPVFLPGRNSMDRGAWQAPRTPGVQDPRSPWGHCEESDAAERLTHTHKVTWGTLVQPLVSGHWKQSLGVQTWGKCTISVAICFQFRSIHSNLFPRTTTLITTYWPLKQPTIRNLRGIPAETHYKGHFVKIQHYDVRSPLLTK